jgi:hypothetical protein
MAENYDDLDWSYLDEEGPSTADSYNLLRLLEVAGGGLDIRALVRRARMPPDRLKAAIMDAHRLGRVRVRLRGPRINLPDEVGNIARVTMTRLGRRWGLRG